MCLWTGQQQAQPHVAAYMARSYACLMRLFRARANVAQTCVQERVLVAMHAVVAAGETRVHLLGQAGHVFSCRAVVLPGQLVT